MKIDELELDKLEKLNQDELNLSDLEEVSGGKNTRSYLDLFQFAVYKRLPPREEMIGMELEDILKPAFREYGIDYISTPLGEPDEYRDHVTGKVLSREDAWDVMVQRGVAIGSF